MVVTVEIYAKIRKMHLAGMSQRAIARELHISRKTVRKYMNGEVLPGERSGYTTREATVSTDEVKEFINSCLEEDENEGTKKQRHTAKRIYERLVDETGFTGGASTVRGLVRAAKEKKQEAFVPLYFAPGDAVQVDWGEFTGYINGKREKLYHFCARLCSCDAPFVAAYRRQNFESFQDAIIRMFEFFGGVPRKVIFDNARIAVKDGFGAHAKVTDKYAALSAHYCFDPVFCNVRSGNEKGLVEGLVNTSRSNFLVPIPKFDSMEDLNAHLEQECIKYRNHRVQGHNGTVAEEYEVEKAAMYPLPERKYDPCRRIEARVSRYSLVCFEKNRYSVPVDYVGKTVTVKVLPEKISIWADGKQIASHTRWFRTEQSIYDLKHYLPLLRQKGRAIFQAKPFLDNVPEEFVKWLEKRKDDGLKPKELVDLIELALEIGFDKVMRGDIRINTRIENESSVPDPVPVEKPDMSVYDSLLGEEVSA